MSRCKHCGTEHGMACGTGDCGCEDTFDVGCDFEDSIQDAKEREELEKYWEAYSNQPKKKVEITLEGPGIDGLKNAETCLWMAGFPHSLHDGKTSGTYTDVELGISITWKLI